MIDKKVSTNSFMVFVWFLTFFMFISTLCQTRLPELPLQSLVLNYWKYKI